MADVRGASSSVWDKDKLISDCREASYDKNLQVEPVGNHQFYPEDSCSLRP